MEPTVHTIFEPVTGTWQYVVADPEVKEAVIIDPVLNYDKEQGIVSTSSADEILRLVSDKDYKITRILETHAHADHLTASRYLQNVWTEQHGLENKPAVCIGRRIHQVQRNMSERLSIPELELAKAFDHLFDDNESFGIGHIAANVLHLPGHTPDHIGYMIGSNVFTGDSIFNPDVGSARCDFPGGSAENLYESTQKLLKLPGHFKLYTGHDYPPAAREPTKGVAPDNKNPKAVPFTTVAAQRKENKHVKQGVNKADFVKWRTERDSGLSDPKLLVQAMHVNVRGGRLPSTPSESFKFDTATLPKSVALVS